MPTTGNGTSFLEFVTQLTRQSSADGQTFDQIHQQLVDNDTFLNGLMSGWIQKAINSGVYDFASLTANLTANPNAFQLAKETANVNGFKQSITNIGGKTDGTNLITLDAPPYQNVTPSLPGSARDDLVFLEAWRDATDGSWKNRIRLVDGVDFATYPEGLADQAGGGNPTVAPQGGLSSPVTFSNSDNLHRFRWAGYSGVFLNQDTGLYTAGDGSSSSKTTLNTADGFVYAIPLFRVRRRNSGTFDPDNNVLGGIKFEKVADKSTGLNIATGQTGNLVFNNSDFDATSPFPWYVGCILMNTNNNQYSKVTAVSVGSTQTTVTVENLGSSPIVSNSWAFQSVSDRPDGLFSNIIDASDIIDLRHQVSLTGFNYQALLEKNLDLLLRGQLNTKDTPRYGRDYIGLNMSSYTDDVNTLLFAKFDGSINGTANGAAVTGTMNTGSPSFVNGVQGEGLAASTSQYVSYPISLPIGTNTYTMEIMIKPKWNWNDGANHSLFALMNGSTPVLAVYKHSSNTIKVTPISGGTLVQQYATCTSPINPKNAEWVKIIISVNAGVVSCSVNGAANSVVYSSGGTIAALSNSITSVVVGDDRYTMNYANSDIDNFRLSNIVRSESQMPSGFSYSNGDRILDGPNGDFNMWSDDQGGIAGLNGRTNPYGLTNVPNQIAGRVSYNGSEVRHYYGDGLAAGWTTNNGSGFAPSGSFENSSEFITVFPNETVDGTRTNFTFNKPNNANGIFVVNNINRDLEWIDDTNKSLTSATIDTNGKLTLVYATAPASGSNIHAVYEVAQGHAHFIPSTKGFVLHDWTDDSITAGATPPTVYQTTKYNVTSLNHVRVTPNGGTAGAIQNGGYSTSGLNARTTLSATAASGATTLSVASGSNFVANQNIRVSKGDGTWYTTTVTSVSGNTLTIPATTVALSANAVVEGAALVTFTTAPATNSTIDIVYESVITPALGDYIRVMYQSTPYQGVGDSSMLDVLYLADYVAVTSYGTGVVNTNNEEITSPITVNFPSAYYSDYNLKSDSIVPSKYFESYAGNRDDFNVEAIQRRTVHPLTKFQIGNWNSGSAQLPSRGYGNYITNTDQSQYKYAFGSENLDASVPHLSIYPLLVANENTGEVLLVTIVRYTTDTKVGIATHPYDYISLDYFKVQGRPLVKANAGVTN